MAAVLFLLWHPAPSAGSNAVQWITNYYSITGATLPEIRQSMQQSRPWKNRVDLDGLTEWHVTWTFSTVPTATGCRCSTFTTTTKIVTTLPRWTKPSQAGPEVAETWKRYLDALTLHEAGHGGHGISAASLLHTGVQALSERPTCGAMTQAINELGQRTVAEFRQKDKDYDQQTRHGATQGARLPGRGRRPR